MDEKYIRDRITTLRVKKDVSEQRMSYDLGHSKSYINHISSGRSSPKMKEFLAICDYFEITPKDFFDDEMDNAPIIRKAMECLKELSEEDVELILSMVQKLSSKDGE